ncbi:MAG: hypothetical protein JJE46_07945 [Acidimicrobiia bacterium]|nr:hypothetical protein [Acidimicrobiia bacterium]
MVLVLVLVLPVVIVVAAAVAAFVSVRNSSLRITAAGVEIRNYPQAPTTVPLQRVKHFEPTPSVGNFSGLRPTTGVLVLTDGTRMVVRKLSDPDAGTGIDALNARIASLRSNP